MTRMVMLYTSNSSRPSMNAAAALEDMLVYEAFAEP